MSAEPHLTLGRPFAGGSTHTKIAAAHIDIHPEVLRRWARKPGQHPWLPKPIRVGKAFRWNINALDTGGRASGYESSHLPRRLPKPNRTNAPSCRAVAGEYGYQIASRFDTPRATRTGWGCV